MKCEVVYRISGESQFRISSQKPEYYSVVWFKNASPAEHVAREIAAAVNDMAEREAKEKR